MSLYRCSQPKSGNKGKSFAIHSTLQIRLARAGQETVCTEKWTKVRISCCIVEMKTVRGKPLGGRNHVLASQAATISLWDRQWPSYPAPAASIHSRGRIRRCAGRSQRQHEHSFYLRQYSFLSGSNSASIREVRGDLRRQEHGGRQPAVTLRRHPPQRHRT